MPQDVGAQTLRVFLKTTTAFFPLDKQIQRIGHRNPYLALKKVLLVQYFNVLISTRGRYLLQYITLWIDPVIQHIKETTLLMPWQPLRTS